MLGGTEINWAGQVKNFAITVDKGPPLLIFCEGDSLKEGSFLSIGIKKKKGCANGQRQQHPPLIIIINSEVKCQLGHFRV